MSPLDRELRDRARIEGFDSVAVTRTLSDQTAASRFAEFVAKGHHGTMTWLMQDQSKRADPKILWPEARSAIVLAQSYGQGLDPAARLSRRETGNIALYALGRDYHDVVKGRLKRFGQWFSHRSAAKVKVFLDTAPLMEKPLAQRAGLGWQGRHTNLVSRELGSWFFIGIVLTTAELAADEPETDHCGSCRACLDICPTAAFPAPYQLDARRCISYLTIEYEDHIPREFRKAIGNRVYGCDDCLAVCPWNKFASIASEQKLRAREHLVAPPLEQLLSLDETSFRSFFSSSPVKRTGRNRFLRNVLIAAGNSGDAKLIPYVRTLLADPSPIVHAMAIWALRQLMNSADFNDLRNSRRSIETDPLLISEWDNP